MKCNQMDMHIHMYYNRIYKGYTEAFNTNLHIFTIYIYCIYVHIYIFF